MAVQNSEKKNYNLEGVRLKEFRVFELFEEFSYTINLNLESHVTAIIAPNGTGKTICLRLIDALFGQKWSVFSDTAFSELSYIFSDNTSVIIKKSRQKEFFEENGKNSSFIIHINLGGLSESIDWTPRFFDSKRAFQVERYLPFLSRITPTKWRNNHTGDVLSLPQIIEFYGPSLPLPVRATAYGRPPEILEAISKHIDCRLIETQRLLILRDEADDPYLSPSARRGGTNLAIARKAVLLKEIISKEINAYATLSQSLDRSFPQRVIRRPTSMPTEDLKIQLERLDGKRRELMEGGILDTEADDPVSLPEGTLEPAIARVLSVYAEDTEKKLATLSRLLERIKLFKELIDQRFVTKDVVISKQNGMEVLSNNNKVPLEKLSSGEQHQLVLLFELLFEIKSNSLILIDEPELSLHVAWQKKFISDLMRIIALNKFDVVLATHSPQLIGRWNDLVIELGDVYEDSDEEFGG